jgi:Domain of unknown function (DUF4185)
MTSKSKSQQEQHIKARASFMEGLSPLTQSNSQTDPQTDPVSTLIPTGTWIADLSGSEFCGVTSADLGIPRRLPNGQWILFYGDTFSGDKVGAGDWRSPVALIFEWDGDPTHPMVLVKAAGIDPKYADQLIPYTHDSPPWANGGISTKIPGDAIINDDVLYLQVVVNHGFGTVPRIEIWSLSLTDGSTAWTLVTTFPGDLHGGLAQLWSWDYCAKDGYIYIVSTEFKDGGPVILRRVRKGDIADPSKYVGWGWADEQWAWGNEPTSITPNGEDGLAPEQWRELTLRFVVDDKDNVLFVLFGGLCLSHGGLGYRVLTAPTDNLHAAPLQMAVLGTTWDKNDPAHGYAAQVYGGYVLGAIPHNDGTIELALIGSQWNTDTNLVYKAEQFRAILANTTVNAGKGSKVG